MKLEFIGDWEVSEATEIAQQLKKSLSMGDSEDLNPPAIVSDFPSLLSKRQKKLVEMLQKAGGECLDGEHEPCEPESRNWDAYSLEKAASDEDGISDTEIELEEFKEEFRERIDRAVAAGAMPGEVAEAVLEVSEELTEDQWLNMANLRREGRELIAERIDLNRPETYATYLRLLAGRGSKFWIHQLDILRCMAEDYRYAHDEFGLPNLMTLEWDLAVPAIARMSQQVLLSLLNAKSES